MSPVSAFVLRCDIYNSQFTLGQRGEDWVLDFDTFEKAYEQAEARATSPTPWSFTTSSAWSSSRFLSLPFRRN